MLISSPSPPMHVAPVRQKISRTRLACQSPIRYCTGQSKIFCSPCSALPGADQTSCLFDKRLQNTKHWISHLFFCCNVEIFMHPTWDCYINLMFFPLNFPGSVRYLPVTLQASWMGNLFFWFYFFPYIVILISTCLCRFFFIKSKNTIFPINK